MYTNLQTPIDYLKGVGPNRADLLRKELAEECLERAIKLAEEIDDIDSLNELQIDKWSLNANFNVLIGDNYLFGPEE